MVPQNKNRLLYLEACPHLFNTEKRNFFLEKNVFGEFIRVTGKISEAQYQIASSMEITKDLLLFRKKIGFKLLHKVHQSKAASSCLPQTRNL